MQPTNLNGGLKATKSKGLGKRLKIIGDTPEMTKDIKDTIEYLENLVINKETIKNINYGELVKQINRLIQYVEVLSVYKKPFFHLIDAYNNACLILKSNKVSLTIRKYNQLKRDIIFESLQDMEVQNILNRKDFWEDYE